ncbi:hypothetical protein [uncultured Sphingomonas sp.]|uniref:hypothetical protein n=1 Tax=uncultured Sphingomonas sp. TaxID=158754 RepID=UPI0025DD6382|nr:hypothetical protein [uncultured Sphingomonas sp.]
MTIKRYFVSSPLAILTADADAVLKPTRLSTWKRENADWRHVLHSDTTRRLFAVAYSAQGPIGIADDCLGRAVLNVNLAVVSRMMMADDRWPFWYETLSHLRRYGWRPVKLRRWLGTFLRPADADRALDDMLLIERLASGETLTARAVGMERLFDLTGDVRDRAPLHLGG